MSYCSYTDLVERFGSVEIAQITNQSGPCPAIDSAIADADAEINAYVASRYSMPLADPTPDVLRRCACELVRYYLWDDKATEHVRKRYEDAVSILKGLADGTTVLPISDLIPVASSKPNVFFSESPNFWKRGAL